MKDYVWYACYGSNLSEDRFLCYINGGVCEYNGRKYYGCMDKSAPLAAMPIDIPYRLYFGNKSDSWEGCGVAFLYPEPDSKAITKGRMYLINYEQYTQVHEQEGLGPNWYDKQIDLGEVDGCRILTFTNSNVRPFNMPSGQYFRVMADGLRETYPDMNLSRITDYLGNILKGQYISTASVG